MYVLALVAREIVADHGNQWGSCSLDTDTGSTDIRQEYSYLNVHVFEKKILDRN